MISLSFDAVHQSLTVDLHAFPAILAGLSYYWSLNVAVAAEAAIRYLIL